MLIRENSSERQSAGLVLASATFSGPGTLLIRTRLAAVSACNHRNRTSRQRRRCRPLLLGTPTAPVLSEHKMNVHVLSARHEQSLDVLRFTRGCCGLDVISFLDDD